MSENDTKAQTAPVESASAVVEKTVKKNKAAIRMGLVFGFIFSIFAIGNTVIPFLACLTIFIIWGLKFFNGLVLADVKSLNKDNLFKGDALSSMGIYSVVSALIEGIIGGVFGVLWGLIFTKTTFFLAASIISSFVMIFVLMVGNFIFTLLGALLYAYLDKSTLAPVAGLIKGVRGLLKI